MRAKALKALRATRTEVIAHFKKRAAKIAKDADDDADDIMSGMTLGEIKALALIDDDLAGVATDGGELFISQLKVAAQDEMFGQVSQRAVAYARDRAAELVTQIDESTRDEIRDIISAGLESNIGMDAIADQLQDAYAFSEERADLIARTEIAMANQNGVLEGMRAARNAGVRLKKVWLPDAEACDDCQDNGDDGAIDIDEAFSTGDDAPPAHPNCRCDMASEVEEDSEGEADAGDDEEDTADEG